LAVNIAKLPSVPRQILKDIPRPPNSASRDDLAGCAMDTSILCTHGAFVVCPATGFIAGSIWSLVDPGFNLLVYRMVRFSGAAIGAAAGLILDHFFGAWC
jgi:hypothetical protein